MRISDWSSDVCSSDRLEIDDAAPEILAVEQHRDRIDLAGLDQGQQFEQLVERPESARKRRQRARVQQEVHLAEREIVELHAQRSAERRGGNECVSPWRSRCSPHHYKKHIQK